MDRYHRVCFHAAAYLLAPLLLLAGLLLGAPGAVFAAGITGTAALIGLAATNTTNQPNPAPADPADYPGPAVGGGHHGQR
jgi:hypothetical protein